MVDFRPSTQTRSVRVLQHELAHNFGVRDGQLGTTPSYFSPCTGGQDCLMFGNHFDNATWSRTDIWCTNHTSEFNRDLHY